MKIPATFSYSKSIELGGGNIDYTIRGIGTNDGPMTSDGYGESFPEPMMRLELVVDGTDKVIFATRKVSAMALMLSPEQSMLVNMMAYNVVFDNRADDGGIYNRERALHVLKELLKPDYVQDFPVEKTKPRSIFSQIAEEADIKIGTWYSIEQYQHGEYTVWLKRALLREAVNYTQNVSVHSRWSFLKRRAIMSPLGPTTYEDKTVIGVDGPHSKDTDALSTFAAACAIFDGMKK